jgi:hypothetical protein
MERAVALRRGNRFLSRAIGRADGRERGPEARRQEHLPAPVEMRLQKLGDRGRFRRCSRRGRCGHTRPGAGRKLRLTGECQHDDQCQTRGEHTQMTSPPTHQFELIRKAQMGASLKMGAPSRRKLVGRRSACPTALLHATDFSMRTMGSACPSGSGTESSSTER